MTIQQRFESYERYRCELEADICALAGMLELSIPEPDGSLNELGQVLKQIQSSLDFVCDEEIEKRMEHARMRLRELMKLDCAIRSRPLRQRDILYGLYVRRLSWQELEQELHISQMTISRDRSEAFRALKNDFDDW
ncbi:MAG: sigma factor-like helix-turn-helix DNA-binding protein [Fastidiosipilaceae bacterium]|jgi:DNA-directed RNA polymerase specialized sigma24 family protein